MEEERYKCDKILRISFSYLLYFHLILKENERDSIHGIYFTVAKRCGLHREVSVRKPIHAQVLLLILMLLPLYYPELLLLACCCCRFRQTKKGKKEMKKPVTHLCVYCYCIHIKFRGKGKIIRESVNERYGGRKKNREFIVHSGIKKIPHTLLMRLQY